jgi:hypothetical protein
MISPTSDHIHTNEKVASSSRTIQLPFVSANQQCYLSLPASSHARARFNVLKNYLLLQREITEVAAALSFTYLPISV